jgi:hypothetical protein
MKVASFGCQVEEVPYYEAASRLRAPAIYRSTGHPDPLSPRTARLALALQGHLQSIIICITSLTCTYRYTSSSKKDEAPSPVISVYSLGAPCIFVIHLLRLTLLRLISDGRDFFGLRSIIRLVIFLFTW